MGGNVAKQIAEQSISQTFESAISMSFESTQRNTQLASSTQIVSIRGQSGLFAFNKINQSSRQQLSVSAFTQSNVQADLINNIIAEMKAKSAQEGVDGSFLQGFMNSNENISRLRSDMKNSIDVAIKSSSEIINKQMVGNAQVVDADNQRVLFAVNLVDQEAVAELIMTSMIEAALKTQSANTMRTAASADMSQKITNPFVAMTQAFAAGLWGLGASILFALLSPIIMICIIGAAIYFAFGSDAPAQKMIGEGEHEVFEMFTSCPCAN